MLAASPAGKSSAESRFPLHALVWHDQPTLLEQALASGQQVGIGDPGGGREGGGRREGTPERPLPSGTVNRQQHPPPEPWRCSGWEARRRRRVGECARRLPVVVLVFPQHVGRAAHGRERVPSEDCGLLFSLLLIN